MEHLSFQKLVDSFILADIHSIDSSCSTPRRLTARRCRLACSYSRQPLAVFSHADFSGLIYSDEIGAFRIVAQASVWAVIRSQLELRRNFSIDERSSALI
jgi:hypothetical protein